MIPVPSGSRSSWRTGGGLTISKARKSTKPARKVFHARGAAIRAMVCPATSSITTNCGSLTPEALATWVAAGIPINVTSRARAIATGVRDVAGSADAKAVQSTTAAAEPQVPGPGCRRPTPKNVAISFAQRGPRGSDEVFTALASGSSAMFTTRPQCLRHSARESIPRHLLPGMKSHTPRLPTFPDRSDGSGRCRRESPAQCSSQLFCRLGK